MPKGEHDRIWVWEFGTGSRAERQWSPSKIAGSELYEVPYLRETPARAAAEQMLEALELAQHMMRNTNVPGGHGEGLLPAFAWDHPAMVKIRAAIAAAQGGEDG